MQQQMGYTGRDLRFPHEEMKPIDRKTLLPLLSVAAVFIISRFLYQQAGIHFDGDTYLGHWQFIDPLRLRTDLWRSVYYLHSQPPLLNLLTGLILQAFPSNHQEVFQFLFFVSGLVLAISIYLLGQAMQFPGWLSATLSMWFTVSPGTVLYENLFGYTYPLATALTLAGVALYQFIRSGKNRWGSLFFFLLAAIALTWSLFHIIWLFAIVILLVIILRERKKVIITALLPILLVTGWYAKNLYLVGEFTASSWAGMNLSKIATFRYPEKERKRLVKAGELSKFALLPPFRSPPVYLKLLPDTPLTGIPLWDEVETSQGSRNHHHLVYVKASGYYLRDALIVIRLNPGYYARSVIQALYIYFHSPSDYDHTLENRRQIKELDRWWNRLFYGQWQSNETSIGRNLSMSAENVGWCIIVSFVVVIVCSILYLWKNRAQLSKPLYLLVLFMLVNILFVSTVGNLMDIGENNRFRFVVDPFLLILFVFFLRTGISRFLTLKPKTVIPEQMAKSPGK